MNEKLLKIVHEVCKIFNRKFKDKYLAHYFLYYDILIKKYRGDCL